jgi:hypothetical protein
VRRAERLLAEVVFFVGSLRVETALFVFVRVAAVFRLTFRATLFLTALR